MDTHGQDYGVSFDGFGVATPMTYIRDCKWFFTLSNGSCTHLDAGVNFFDNSENLGATISQNSRAYYSNLLGLNIPRCFDTECDENDNLTFTVKHKLVPDGKVTCNSGEGNTKKNVKYINNKEFWVMCP